ncbi:MAG: hypothetical protein HS116_20435 [Planctomycetes bacterium]|nr:hypothetical protein [Planctomycetota bacterium]
MLLYALFAVLGLIALPFVLGPVLIKFTQRMPAQPEFAALDSERELPPEVYALFKDAVTGLQALGFETHGFLSPVNPMAGQTQYLALFSNPQNRDLAMAAGIFQVPITSDSLRTLYVEFMTRFEGSESLCTNNSKEIFPFPKVEGKRVEQFVSAQNPSELYGLHRALLQERAFPPVRALPEPGGYARLVSESMIEGYDMQIGTGYLAKTDDGSHYIPTWKGACLMTWRLCWPLSAWIRGRRDSRAEALRAKLAAR